MDAPLKWDLPIPTSVCTASEYIMCALPGLKASAKATLHFWLMKNPKRVSRVSWSLLIPTVHLLSGRLGNFTFSPTQISLAATRCIASWNFVVGFFYTQVCFRYSGRTCAVLNTFYWPRALTTRLTVAGLLFVRWLVFCHSTRPRKIHRLSIQLLLSWWFFLLNLI